MNYADTIEYLFGRKRLGMKYGLERMDALLADLGNPQRRFRTIHVVGTNGKGSTTALLSEISRQLGYKTGRTTSPHLLDYRERVSIDGRWIPPGAVTGFVKEYRPLIEKHEATFFEITTAMAAWHFAANGAQWVIAEAGLGGRLDATNTYAGETTIFTGVDIEHARILGRTRSAITREKLAIAAPGTLLVAARHPSYVERTIRQVVEESSLLRALPVEPEASPLEGPHQIRNAGLALAAALLTFEKSEEEIRAAFGRACSDLRWPGRLDLRRGRPDILFDVAHNPQSLARLCGHLEQRERPVAGVVGFLEDKPWRRMASQLRGYLDPVVATTPLSDRLLRASALAVEFQRLGIRCTPLDGIEQAMEEGRRLAADLLVVTGSFYVVGEAMLSSWRRGWISPPEGEEAQVLDTPEPVRGKQ
jgi:dihydrofolate synthase/folylpolyglutamate synthase